MEQTNSNNFIQDRTISAATGKTLRIFLSNGLSYYGQIYAYDTYSVVFLPCELKDGTAQRAEKTVLIYKSSISAIEVYDKIEELIDSSPYINKDDAIRKAYQRGKNAGMKEALDKIHIVQKNKSKVGHKKKANNAEKKPQSYAPALTNPDDIDFGGVKNSATDDVIELPDVTLEMTEDNKQPTDDVLVDEETTPVADIEQLPTANDVQEAGAYEQPEEKEEENKVDKMMEEMFSFKG